MYLATCRTGDVALLTRSAVFSRSRHVVPLERRVVPIAMRVAHLSTATPPMGGGVCGWTGRHGHLSKSFRFVR